MSTRFQRRIIPLILDAIATTSFGVHTSPHISHSPTGHRDNGSCVHAAATNPPISSAAVTEIRPVFPSPGISASFSFNSTMNRNPLGHKDAEEAKLLFPSDSIVVGE